MFDNHNFLGKTTVATSGAPSPATSGTSMTVDDSSLLPSPPYNATVGPSTGELTQANSEEIRVTADASGTLTIVRDQAGNGARTIVDGDRVIASVGTKPITDLEAPRMMYSSSFENQARLNENFYGAGASSWGANGYHADSSAGSASATKGLLAIDDNGLKGDFRFGVFVNMEATDTADIQWFGGLAQNIGVSEVTGIDFSGYHVGFKMVIDSGQLKLYGTQSDGTEAVTSALTNIAFNDTVEMRLFKKGTTNCTYWWRVNRGTWSSGTVLTAHLPNTNGNYIEYATSNVNSTSTIKVRHHFMFYES